MLRRLEPELLDRLDPGDPAAIASRRDLARINHVMLQHRLMARALRNFAPPRLLVDLGSGDGCFLLGVAKRLPHLKELGVSAVELMPIADFSGTRNWGYDGVLPYAPSAAYGTPDELKALIDTAHGLGLCVYLDVVCTAGNDLKFKKRLVVCDSSRIDTLLALPL